MLGARPPERLPGLRMRHYRISFVATERLIEKLVHLTVLVSEPGDEASIAEVIEVALDSLLEILT